MFMLFNFASFKRNQGKKVKTVKPEVLIPNRRHII